MPRLSVIMPAYNAERTIASAVMSTLKYLPSDAELVVLDDASSDNTVRELEKQADRDRRLILHREQMNVGAAGSLQKLLLRTDSDFVARMDADDVVLPGRFKYQMAAMNEMVDFSFMTVVHYRPDSAKSLALFTPSLPLQISAQAMPLHLLLRNPVAHSTMLARRAAIESAGGYRQVPAEDYDLWLRAVLNGSQLVRLATPGIAYRHHKNQVTADAKWIRAAATNEQTRDVHEALTQFVTGTRYSAFDFLRGAPSVDGLEQFSRLKSSLLSHSRVLPLFQRLAFRLMLQKVAAQYCETHRSQAADDRDSPRNG